MTDERKMFVDFVVKNKEVVSAILNHWLAKCGRHVSDSHIDKFEDTEGGFRVYIAFNNFLSGEEREWIRKELLDSAEKLGAEVQRELLTV